MKTFALLVFVQAESLDEARECWSDRGQLDRATFPVLLDQWPIWAKALKQFATPQDKGLGDVVARTIGAETSEAFKKYYKQIFGKECGCTGRHRLWNQQYPLTE